MAEVSDRIEFDAKANSYLFKINSWATELDSKVAIMRASRRNCFSRRSD